MCQLGQRGARPAFAGALDELDHLIARKSSETHADNVVGPAQVRQGLGQRFRHTGLLLAERRQQEHRPARRTRQVAQQKQRRRVGPLRVVDDQHDPVPASDGVEQVGYRGVESVALGIRIGLRRLSRLTKPGRQIWKQASELPAPAAQRAAQLHGVNDLHEMLEGLCERAIRGARDGVAGAVKHERTIPGYLAGKLAHEATLARPRLAAEEHHAGAFSARPWHQRP